MQYLLFKQTTSEFLSASLCCFQWPEETNYWVMSDWKGVGCTQAIYLDKTIFGCDISIIIHNEQLLSPNSVWKPCHCPEEVIFLVVLPCFPQIYWAIIIFGLFKNVCLFRGVQGNGCEDTPLTSFCPQLLSNNCQLLRWILSLLVHDCLSISAFPAADVLCSSSLCQVALTSLDFVSPSVVSPSLSKQDLFSGQSTHVH